MKRRLEAGFVVRVKQVDEQLIVIILDLREHKQHQFSNWDDASNFLRQHPQPPSLR